MDCSTRRSFDCREQHRRCRKQVCPVSLDEASRGPTDSDDQIGRSLSVERPEIFNKFGLSSVVATPSRDEGLFLNVQRPRRLSVQFIADFPAPCRPPARNSGHTNEGTGFFSAERQARQTWAEQQSRQLRRKERRRRRPTYKRAASAMRCAMRHAVPGRDQSARISRRPIRASKYSSAP